MMSCSGGSFGASQGAPNAKTTRNRIKPPPTTTLGSRRQAPANSQRVCPGASPRRSRATASTMPQPGIGGDDEQIDAHVDENEQRAEDQRQPLDQRQVAVDHGV